MQIRFALFAGLLVGAFVTFAAEVPEPKVVLRLTPQPGNPRNSEGDFIQLKDGRVLFIYTRFTGGDADHASAELAARESRDGGLTWSTNDVTIVRNEGAQNVMSVTLVPLKSGAIALFYLRKNSKADCRPVMRVSRDEARTWSDPVDVITDEIGYYVLNNDRIPQLGSGRLIVPVARHARADGKRQPGELFCYLSDDEGRTWRRSGPLTAKGTNGVLLDLMEPGVVETSAGSAEAASTRLLMLIRTKVGCQYESRSSDGGQTWTAPEPGLLRSPMSPATLTRVPGANTLVCIWNDHRGKPLTLSTTNPPIRTPLAIAVSNDEGKTWSAGRVLEADPQGGYCYTAAEWVGDRLLLGYCAHRSRWGLNTTQITAVDRGWLLGR